MTKFTEQAIQQTFIQLLQERPLSEISVKDITDACGINRNTFYYHYRDLGALVETIMNTEADKIISAHPTIGSLEDCLYAVLDFIKANRTAISHLYHSVSRAVFEKYLWKVCQRLVNSYWRVADQTKRVAPSDRKIITDLFTAECFGLTIGWINQGLDEATTRQAIHRLFTLYQGLPEEMIARSLQANRYI